MKIDKIKHCFVIGQCANCFQELLFLEPQVLFTVFGVRFFLCIC